MKTPSSEVQTSAQPAPGVSYAEPRKGGSYTRDMNTGELVPAAPPPANKSEQE